MIAELKALMAKPLREMSFRGHLNELADKEQLVALKKILANGKVPLRVQLNKLLAEVQVAEVKSENKKVKPASKKKPSRPSKAPKAAEVKSENSKVPAVKKASKKNSPDKPYLNRPNKKK